MSVALCVHGMCVGVHMANRFLCGMCVGVYMANRFLCGIVWVCTWQICFCVALCGCAHGK